MPIAVSFVDHVPARSEAIREAIELLPTEPDHQWTVTVSEDIGDDPCISLTLTRPAGRPRVFHVFGGKEGRHEPAYLAALVGAVVNSFPARLPDDFAFAAAELTRLGIPYDDTRAFEGTVAVNGVDMPVDHLAALYQRSMLTPEMLSRYARGLK